MHPSASPSAPPGQIYAHATDSYSTRVSLRDLHCTLLDMNGIEELCPLISQYLVFRHGLLGKERVHLESSPAFLPAQSAIQAASTSGDRVCRPALGVYESIIASTLHCLVL